MNRSSRNDRRLRSKKSIPIKLRIKSILNKDAANEELSRLKIIRLLSDDFRATVSIHDVFFSPRILALDLIDQMSVLERVRRFDSFDEDLDMLHERGTFTYAENSIVWEVHCFDLDLKNPSPDASDIHQTRRQLIISFDGELE